MKGREIGPFVNQDVSTTHHIRHRAGTVCGWCEPMYVCTLSLSPPPLAKKGKMSRGLSIGRASPFLLPFLPFFLHSRPYRLCSTR